MDIEALAIQAGLEPILGILRDADDVWSECDVIDGLERFALRAVTQEREGCKEACRKIAAQYPTDIWPEDGETLDCKSARMARLTAANCEREIDMRSNAEVNGGRLADRPSEAV